MPTGNTRLLLSFAFEGMPLTLSLPHLSLFSVFSLGECPYCSPSGKQALSLLKTEKRDK